jgi:hypothetical protein
MKPSWDKLMKKFDGHASTLIGDVDCTADGKSLCNTIGVQGYPTIKHGDPAALEDYEGGRDYDALEAFAHSLKPMCSPSNLSLCDADQKANIEKVQALSDADLAKQISEGDAAMQAADDTFKSEVEKLQQKYEQLQKDQTDAKQKVKDSGLSLLKSVQAARKKPKKEEL